MTWQETKDAVTGLIAVAMIVGMVWAAIQTLDQLAARSVALNPAAQHAAASCAAPVYASATMPAGER